MLGQFLALPDFLHNQTKPFDLAQKIDLEWSNCQIIFHNYHTIVISTSIKNTISLWMPRAYSPLHMEPIYQQVEANNVNINSLDHATLHDLPQTQNWSETVNSSAQ